MTIRYHYYDIYNEESTMIVVPFDEVWRWCFTYIFVTRNGISVGHEGRKYKAEFITIV